MNKQTQQLPVVLLTGASAGIGRETATLLARRGYRVFGASRSPHKTAPIPGVTMMALDLNDVESIHTCVDGVRAQAGRIDYLINNAGMVGPGASGEELDIRTVRALFEINFFGAVQLINAVLPEMRARRSGVIVNISSITGMVALPPYFAFYAASKHALEAYTEGLRHELAPLGIRVALVEPGYTKTAIGDSIAEPDHPIADYAPHRTAVRALNRAGILSGSAPEEVAHCVLRVVESRNPALRNLTGPDAVAMALAKRFLPARIFEELGRWLFAARGPAAGSVAAAGTVPSLDEMGIRRLVFDVHSLRRLLQASAAVTAGALLLGAIFRTASKRQRSNSVSNHA
jgi:NAD(P)-dependent dehydrogenase (short-subunit alcohol dehydrogenase family)